MRTINLDSFGEFESSRIADKFNTLNKQECSSALVNFEKPVMADFGNVQIILRENPAIKILHMEIIPKAGERMCGFAKYPLNQTLDRSIVIKRVHFKKSLKQNI